jgi:glycosyltransferase involved in cell wall biosynthesis
MTIPDVSVIIPTHNRASSLGDAVGSCIQEGCRVEVLVVDDGSTDDSVAGLRARFAGLLPLEEDDTGRAKVRGDPDAVCLRIVSQAQAGPAAARNHGLRLATGEFVKFLDSDDLLMQGFLCREIAHARQTGVDVLVTGWREKRLSSEGPAGAGADRHVPAPDLARGVDDLLQGKAVWTAAALYRRAFVKDLAWNAEDGKADDWGWLWTVALAGARFTSLDVAAAIYHLHSGERVSLSGDAFQKSTHVRQRILRRVEASLASRGDLTEPRRRALAQYYFKDAKPLCERSRKEWRDLWRHCSTLAPGHVLRDADWLTQIFVGVLGPYRGIVAFVALRRAARWLGVRRTHGLPGASGCTESDASSQKSNRLDFL